MKAQYATNKLNIVKKKLSEVKLQHESHFFFFKKETAIFIQELENKVQLHSSRRWSTNIGGEER